MARPPTMVIQEDYIDMDLTPTTTSLPPSSPHCGLREFEFQSAATGGGGGGGASKHREAAFASPADELFYRGNLLPLHLPPRFQLVQKLLQEQQVQVQVQVQEIKKPTSAGALACADAEVEEDMTKVCAKKYSWSKRLKLMTRWTSREYIKSLFLAKPSDTGIGNGGSGGGKGNVLDQEELCSHRKSFSGIIRRVRLVATKAAAPPGVSPLCSSSSSSSSSTPSCGNANGFFLRTTTPALKRSSSARSEEGAIQGAIAHCKRSQQQQQQGIISARRSVSDVVFYSVANTPRVSSVAAANDAAQERQEMCRG